MFKLAHPQTHAPQVIVVEDEPVLREAICTYLNLDGFRASGVGSIQAFLAWTGSHPFYDLVVVETHLPDGNGLEIPRVHINLSKVGVVVISSLGELDDRLDGLHAGADVYLVKPLDFRELSATLRNISRRITKTRDTSWAYNRVTWELTSPENKILRLTRLEALIIERLASTPGESVTRSELALQLGETPSTYDPRRMEILIRRLRRKSQVRLEHRLPLETVHGVGYAFTALVRIV